MVVMSMVKDAAGSVVASSSPSENMSVPWWWPLLLRPVQRMTDSDGTSR
jgi:hypothetical protein